MKNIIASASPSKKGVRVDIASEVLYFSNGVDKPYVAPVEAPIKGRLATRQEKIERGYPVIR